MNVSTQAAAAAAAAATAAAATSTSTTGDLGYDGLIGTRKIGLSFKICHIHMTHT